MPQVKTRCSNDREARTALLPLSSHNRILSEETSVINWSNFVLTLPSVPFLMVWLLHVESFCLSSVGPLCWLMPLLSLLKEVSVSATNPAILLLILKIEVSFLMPGLYFCNEFISLYSIMTSVNLRLFVCFRKKATTPTGKFRVDFIEQYFLIVKCALKSNV